MALITCCSGSGWRLLGRLPPTAPCRRRLSTPLARPEPAQRGPPGPGRIGPHGALAGIWRLPAQVALRRLRRLPTSCAMRSPSAWASWVSRSTPPSLFRGAASLLLPAVPGLLARSTPIPDERWTRRLCRRPAEPSPGRGRCGSRRWRASPPFTHSASRRPLPGCGTTAPSTARPSCPSPTRRPSPSRGDMWPAVTVDKRADGHIDLSARAAPLADVLRCLVEPRAFASSTTAPRRDRR
jgi:hypothetical protein